MQHLALRADNLVDRLDHVHRNTDRAGLVSDGARDGLADPPGRIGREFVAAAIFELIDRFHQADIAFLDEIEELQAAIGVLLRNGDHEAKVRFDHFLLGDARFALTFLDALDDEAVVVNRDTDFLRHSRNLFADVIDLLAFLLEEFFPFLLRFGGADRFFLPGRVQLVAEIAGQEFLARHTMRIGEAHQLALKPHQLLVDRIELFNQRFDTRIVDVHRLQIVDDGL